MSLLSRCVCHDSKMASGHNMEKLSTLVIGGFPHRGQVIRCFDVVFLSLNNILKKQSSCFWFGTAWPSCGITLTSEPLYPGRCAILKCTPLFGCVHTICQEACFSLSLCLYNSEVQSGFDYLNNLSSTRETFFMVKIRTLNGRHGSRLSIKMSSYWYRNFLYEI